MENIEYTDLFTTVRDMTPTNKLVYVLRRQDTLPAIYGLTAKPHRNPVYTAKQTRARRYEIFLKTKKVKLKPNCVLAYRPVGKLVFSQAEKFESSSIATHLANIEGLIELTDDCLTTNPKHIAYQCVEVLRIWKQVVEHKLIKPKVLVELETIQGLLELHQG